MRTSKMLTHLTPLGALVLLVVPLVPLGADVTHAQGPQLYRWVDDQGNVNYTDKIPPSQAEKGHTRLSQDGMRVQTVPPAKTLDEIQRERELERLRAEQQRLMEQQKADDRVLLRTFRSVDDLIMVRDGKISAIDVMIQVTKSNIRRQQDWLTQLRAEAAELERAGEPVPDQLKARVAGTERSLNQALAAILDREQQKQKIRESFARDLTRLRQLKDVPEEADVLGKERQLSTLENLIECEDERTCEQLWKRALDYLTKHATLPVEGVYADLAMTEAPTSRDDIALTLSRIRHKRRGGAVIFLDLQCRNYSSSADACRTEPRLAVLNGFRPALETAGVSADR
ncbi:MAG: DUF4124 domain-containing protein [Thiohalocapsa sp.]